MNSSLAPELFVNSKKVTFPQNHHHKTINELINYILGNFAKNDEIVANIQLDGKSIPFDEDEVYFKSSIEQYQSIHFTLKSRTELAFDALDSCNAYLEVIVEKIQLAVPFYQQSKTNEANEAFSEIIDLLDLFIQLMTHIHKIIRVSMNKNTNLSKTFHNLEIHLLSVLKAMLSAREKQDIVMLCDLLEYELVDNLTQWKITAIPTLRQLKNN